MALKFRIALINVLGCEHHELTWFRDGRCFYFFNEIESSQSTDDFGYYIDFEFGMSGFNLDTQPITERELFLIALRLMGVN